MNAREGRGVFDMIFEPTLFNANKLNHYHLLFPSPKKKKKKKRPPLCVARDKYLL